MKLAHLAPISILEQTIGDQMLHLCLANLILEDRRYLTFYHHQLRQGRQVILDTPAFERIEMSLDDVCEAARGLQPSMVILPDDMDNPKHSITRMMEAAARLRKWNRNIRLMAVPHGATVEEYIENAHQCTAINGVTRLGIQEEIEDDFGITREEMVLRLDREFPRMEFHFNGFTDGMFELEDDFCQNRVASGDSAKLVVFGLNGLEPIAGQTDFPDYPGRKSLFGVETSMDYFHWEQNQDDNIPGSAWNLDSRIANVRNNIRRWNALADNGQVID